MKKDKKMNNAPTTGFAPAGAGKMATKKKGGKGLKITAVILMCVLIASLSGVMVFLLLTGSSAEPDIPIDPPDPIYTEARPAFDPGSVVINGKIPEKLDYKIVPNRDGVDFDFDGFFGYFGFSVVKSLDENENTVITVSGANQTAVFTVDSTTVAVTNNETGKTYSVEISQAPYVENDMTYFFIEDMCYVFSDACVHYDEENEITYIYFAAEHMIENAESVENADTAEAVEEAPAE